MKRQALILDLDGTLVDNASIVQALYVNNPNPEQGNVDWQKYNEQSRFAPHAEWAREICELFSRAGYKIVILTGRGEGSRKTSEEWLNNHLGAGIDWVLHMRPDNCKDPDFVVKQALYYKEVVLNYDVLFAVDDRSSIAAMFRALGIPCLHCADY